MARYRIDTKSSRLVVRARSSIHDTSTTWSALSGDIDAHPDTLEERGATADIAVDMTEFDAGDWLKNRKLRKDFDLADHPRADFQLNTLEVIRRDGDRFQATAKGTLRWRGRTVQLSVAGEGTLTDTTLEATGVFDFDIRELGLQAPKFLMIKMDDVVAVEVILRAHAQ
jgi:polyisoprenoid-binding protein YceI